MPDSASRFLTLLRAGISRDAHQFPHAWHEIGSPRRDDYPETEHHEGATDYERITAPRRRRHGEFTIVALDLLARLVQDLSHA